MSIRISSSTREDMSSIYSALSCYENDLLSCGAQVKKDDLFVPEWEPLDKILKLPEVNNSFFASWKSADIPVILLAGFAGSLGSFFSRDFFAGIHDRWGRIPALPESDGGAWGGHAGEIIDRVPGADQAGGWGHRWKYGHDLLNPFEIDWSQYQQMAEASGTVFPIWMKAAFYWCRHLFQDTFSKEGLPIPGHSYFLQFLNWVQYLSSGGKEGSPWIDPSKDHEMLKIFGTIKMRDVAGTALTTLIMKLYLWGTEENWKEANSKQNYRTCSLMLGAYWVNLCAGLMVPQKAKTLNISLIPLIARYSWALVKINIEISRLLQERDETLSNNWIIIEKNAKRNGEIISTIKREINRLDNIDNELDKRYNKIFIKGV